MDAKSVTIGFVLYFFATGILAGMVQPYISGTLYPFLGWAGVYAGALFASLISFPILILTFWAARKAHIEGEIPETGLILFIPFNLTVAGLALAIVSGTAYLLIRSRRLHRPILIAKS